MGNPESQAFTFQASDVSGQKLVNVKDVPAEYTIGELIEGLLPRMDLPANDSGRPVTYHALLDREGRHLNATERVGEALRENDKIVLQPNIDAG